MPSEEAAQCLARKAADALGDHPPDLGGGLLAHVRRLPRGHVLDRSRSRWEVTAAPVVVVLVVVAATRAEA